MSCNNLQCKNPEIQLCTGWLSASAFLKQHGLNHLQFLLTFSNSHPDDKQVSKEVMASTALNSATKYIYYNPQVTSVVPAALFGRRTSVDTVCSHISCPLVHGLRKYAAATCLLGQTLKYETEIKLSLFHIIS